MTTAPEEALLARRISRPALLISVWTLFGATTLLLVSRYAIRRRLHHQLFADDILAGLAYICLLCHNIVATLAVPTVYLILDLSKDNRSFFDKDVINDSNRLVKLMLLSNFFFRFCIYLVKASLLALLWRLFHTLPAFRRAWAIIVTLTAIGLVLAAVLPPVACPELTALACVTPKSTLLTAVDMYVSTVCDVLTDILIMILPIAFILKSSLPNPQKLGLVGLFLLGFMVVVIAILRSIESDGRSKLPPLSWLLFWSAMEATIAVMVSCFASYKSLFTSRSRVSHYPHPHGHSVSVAVSSRAEANNNRTLLTGVDSREEIVQKMEFEVSYEVAPVSGRRTSAPYTRLNYR